MHFLVLIAAVLANGGLPRVEMKTSLGTVVIELDAGRAPGTVANFLKYVDAGLYDGGIVHRTVTMSNQPRNDVKIEVIQGSPKAKGYGPIRLERTNQTGLLHLDGTISMARSAAPDSAAGDFFICIGDQPSLDYGGARNPDGQGFAAFGKVVAGMDVVQKIQQSPAEGQKLTPPIVIEHLRRVTTAGGSR
jgi:peptidyl-prolyl cis-trans isomerase A (cyclophilin A)